MNRLNNKQVYITGGSSGIGLETALQAFSQGAHLLILGRDQAKLQCALERIEQRRLSASQRLNAVSVDVSSIQALEQIMPVVLEENGAPDILVTSAGIGCGDYFENIPYETFDRVIKTNLYGVRNSIACVLPAMKRNGGRIVIIASMAGLTGMIGYSAYSTSKFALIGFAESIRSDFKRYGISVSLVCPPEVETPLVMEEAKTLPPEARAVKNMAGLLSPQGAGKAIVRAMTGRSFLVIPGLMAKASYLMIRCFPGSVVRLVTDLIIARNQKKS